jgi:hypothetical protein
VAAEVCGLAATTAFDVGAGQRADDYAHAADIYANLCGSPWLIAWVRSVQATLAFWAGQPHLSLEYTRDGLREASGSAASRLHAIAARAYAVTAEPTAAQHCLDAAHDAICQPRQDVLAGEFDFSPARLALCSSAVYVAIADGPQAAQHATQALRLYEASPGPQRRFAVAYAARVELSSARIIDGDLEGVGEVLRPALQVPPPLRTARLARRVNQLHRRLSASELTSAREAQQLRTRINEFRARALPTAASQAPALRA